MDGARVVRQGMIRDEWDFLALDLIDWNRTNGFWPDPAEAMRATASWFINTTHYSVVEIDLLAFPQRDDWPDWHHDGSHSNLGRAFWNAFHACFDGELTFADEPDIRATIQRPSVARLWGDLGKVSAPVLALVQKKMQAHDLWISVVSYSTLVILEPFVSLQDLWIQALGIEGAYGARERRLFP